MLSNELRDEEERTWRGRNEFRSRQRDSGRQCGRQGEANWGRGRKTIILDEQTNITDEKRKTG